MSAIVKGKRIIWGIPAGVITAALASTGTGIIQSASVQKGGDTGTIEDEDGDTVTRIDSKASNKINFEIVCAPDSALPEKGEELTGLGTIDGVNFAVGRTFVDEPKVDYANTAAKKFSISATHYPNMPADDED